MEQTDTLGTMNEREIMDYAATRLERVLILGKPLPMRYLRIVKSAINLLRNPPRKKKYWMRG